MTSRKGQDPVLVPRPRTAPVPPPGLCRFATTSSQAWNFAASTGNWFRLPLSLCVVTQILIWSLWGRGCVCFPKSELDLSGIGTSWPPLMLLPGGAHLGLLPGFERGQHIPIKNLKQAGQSFPIPVCSKGPSLCVHPHCLSEDRKPGEQVNVVFGTHNTLNFARCCHRAVVGLLMGRIFLPAFSCWQAGLISPAPFIQRQRNQPFVHPFLGEVKALVTAGIKSLGSQTGMTNPQRWAWSFLSP